MAQTETTELASQQPSEAEPQRKLPKIHEDVLAAVPGDLQLMVMSDEEEEPNREEPTGPVPWFWCRGDLGAGPSPFASRGASAALIGRSRDRSPAQTLDQSPGLTLDSWTPEQSQSLCSVRFVAKPSAGSPLCLCTCVCTPGSVRTRAHSVISVSL